jgi:hypothetical protein
MQYHSLSLARQVNGQRACMRVLVCALCALQEVSSDMRLHLQAGVRVSVIAFTDSQPIREVQTDNRIKIHKIPSL